jgi:CRISPR/Cas system CSM-associated protein Csm3 (group 7 of RAMP superfamily)
MTVSYYRVKANLRTVTPLHVGTGRRTGVIKHSYPFIPGSVLRGAVGTVILKATCQLDKPLKDHENCEYFEDCLYAQLFGEEFGKSSRIFFRYAYPLHLECKGTYHIAPKTMHICRNRQCRKTYDAMIPPAECKVCEKSLEPYRGYLCSKCGQLEEYPISLSRITSTALDRETTSAAQIKREEEASGTLHTIELIEKGSLFTLQMLVHRDSKEDLKVIQAALERGISDEGIGGGKSRGFGKVESEDVIIEEVSEEQVEKRAEEIDSENFSVRSLSPLLLGGRLLEPSKLLEAARRAYTWIFHEGKPRLPDVELEDRRVSLENYSGWSLKEDKRRRIETGISAGSVFQYKCENSNETLAKALAALEHYAVGAYKPHGCGQVKIEKAR